MPWIIHLVYQQRPSCFPYAPQGSSEDLTYAFPDTPLRRTYNASLLPPLVTVRYSESVAILPLIKACFTPCLSCLVLQTRKGLKDEDKMWKENKLQPVVSYSPSRQENKLLKNFPVNIIGISPLWPTALHWSLFYFCTTCKKKERERECVWASLLISFYGPVFSEHLFMTLRDSMHMSIQCRQESVCFPKYLEGFLLPKFQMLPNCELQLKSLCKIIAERKWYLQQSLSKCKQNTVCRIMKAALIKKWQQSFAIMKERMGLFGELPGSRN